MKRTPKELTDPDRLRMIEAGRLAAEWKLPAGWQAFKSSLPAPTVTAGQCVSCCMDLPIGSRICDYCASLNP